MIDMIDIDYNNGFLRPMTEADLSSILVMRNHIEIRRYMFRQHEISLEEHISWFERVSQDPSIELSVLEINGKCCGFLQFKETNFPGVVDWGFYIDPEAPKGTGNKLGVWALSQSFKKDCLHKICGQVLSWNLNSIKLHKSLGFMQEGILREHYFDGKLYHDLICLSIIRKNWITNEESKGNLR